MHLLKELMEIGYLYTGVSFWIIHLPVSVAVGFPLSASFPVESKRHSSEKLKHLCTRHQRKQQKAGMGFFPPYCGVRCINKLLAVLLCDVYFSIFLAFIQINPSLYT